MGELVANRSSRQYGQIVLLPDTIEDTDRADDSRERVAEVVAEHPQKLVLGPVGGFRVGLRGLRAHQELLALPLDAPALLYERASRDDHDGHRAHEDLQQQERLVLRG